MIKFSDKYKEALDHISFTIDLLIQSDCISTSISPVSSKPKLCLYSISGDSILAKEIYSRTIKYPGVSATVCNTFKQISSSKDTLNLFYKYLNIKEKIIDKVPRFGFSSEKKAEIMESLIHEISEAQKTEEHAITTLNSLVLILLRYADSVMKYNNQPQIRALIESGISGVLEDGCCSSLQQQIDVEYVDGYYR